MEKITIRNFGPIKNAELIIRDINIFIGTGSSGKSMMAKLISIFKSAAILTGIDYTGFISLLADNNIDFEIKANSFLRYEWDGFHIEVTANTFLSDYTLSNNKDAINPIFIPTERIFFPTFSRSIFGLINNNISLPKWLIAFGSKFERARSSLRKFRIEFLNVAYEFDGNNDYISVSEKVKIRLSRASSGLQSLVPMILVIQYNTESGKGKNLFVIEEPELNVYPSSQKDLIEFIVSRINRSGDKIIIITHSPYLLTAIDNLVQAQNTVNLDKFILKEVNDLVPESVWIDFDRVSCYYFDGGNCKSTLDEESKSIGPSNIDNVSIKISDTFEKLLLLKYPS